MFRILVWYRKNLKKRMVVWGPLLFASGWISALILGFCGYYIGYQQINEQKYPLDIFYSSLQLFLINYKLTVSPPNIYLHIARFLAPMMMFLTAILLLFNKFQECVRELYIRTRRRHAIVCGLGFLGPTIVRKCIEQNIPVIAIEKDSASGEIEKCQDNGAVVAIGDATYEGMLRRLRISDAAYCIIATGDDARNIGIINTIKEIQKDRKGQSLNCYVHIADHHLERLLTTGQISLVQPGVVFDFFSIYRKAGEEAVRMWLHLNEGKPDLDHPCVLVIGVGRMGENLILRLAREWCPVFRDYQVKLKIIMLDRKPGKKDQIAAKFPWIENYCTLDQISGELLGGDFLSGNALSQYQHQLSAIFVCIVDETTGMSAALSIRQNFDAHCVISDQSAYVIPIFVRTERDDGVRSFLDIIGKKQHSQVRMYPFPVLFREHSLYSIIGGPREKIARLIHNEYQKGNQQIAEWTELSEELKNSNRDLADFMDFNLHACGYSIKMMGDCSDSHRINPEDIEILAKNEHTRYLQERLRSGWKFGPKKDVVKKIHDGLVPWAELNEENKKITYEMVRRYNRYLAEAGLVAVKE